jgi:phenylacetate-CoA ligase
LFGGEFLPPSHVKLFEQVFGTQQIYSLYGSAETGIWAWSDYSNSPSLFRVIAGLVIEVNRPDSNGYGSLLVSNLYRKRFPIFRYNTGDIGKWVEINNMPYLELKGRERGSFSFNECNYEIDDFSIVLADVERYQIQIKPYEAHTKLTFILITNLNDSDKQKYITLKTQQIYKVFGYKIKNLEVLAGTDLQLYTDRITGKTPAIFDCRTIKPL